MTKIRTIIVDDETFCRTSLSDILSTDKIDIVGLAENGKVLLELLETVETDIIILDLKMPVMTGEEALVVLKEKYPFIKVIILSQDYTDYLAAYSIIHGVAAYLRKESASDHLISAIETVYNEGYYFNDIVTEEILQMFKGTKKIYYYINSKRFSQREIEVLREICNDLTTGQIADKLNISESTVRYHRANLLEKTDSESSLALLKYAVRQKIIRLENP